MVGAVGSLGSVESQLASSYPNYCIFSSVVSNATSNEMSVGIVEFNLPDLFKHNRCFFIREDVEEMVVVFDYW